MKLLGLLLKKIGMGLLMIHSTMEIQDKMEK